ncbi:protein kinase [Streptomyces sp. NPDC001708]|uniref:protein kinase n=1 Tax=Streptomyces sp. NPDC001708 TaxID=3364602 RepID=UPI00368C6346
MSDPAEELPVVVLDAVAPTSQRRILNRRGSAVWEVEGDKGHFAVKLGYPIEATPDWSAQPWTAHAPAREGSILYRLGVEGVSYGEWERGTWNAQPWREGPDLYDLWAGCRRKERPIEPHVEVALSCAEALASLHRAGWSHGDVQPAHFIVGPTATHLIDLALARGGWVPEGHDFPYRGCLVHYEAPEISASVLAIGEAEPSPEADVYALGASLLISATGWRAVEYPDDAPRGVQRQAIVNGKRRKVSVPGKLGALVDGMLSYNPGERPTIAEVVSALS